VALLNPDTEPRPAALTALAEHLRDHPGAGVAAPRLLQPDGTPQPSAYKRLPGAGIVFLELCQPLGFAFVHAPRLDPHRIEPGAWRAGTRVAHVLGAAMLVRRAAYDDAGPLDEGFFLYFEETEWQARVTARGWTIELVPDAQVVHLVRGGEPALAPSPHFVRSADRYLALRGVRPRLRRAAIGAGLLGSRAGLRVLARLKPGASRGRNVARARAFDALWRTRP
jgi:GT2 family glycosyltransferase